MKMNILLLTFFILISCTKDPTQKGYEVLPDMVHSVALEAYSGKMLEAPAGSIARGFKPFHYGKDVKEAERAGRELVNPIAKTLESINRGRVLYSNTCLVCHGDSGKGDGPIIPKFPNPPSFTSKALMEYSDGRIYHVIVSGFGDMPGHSAQLNEEDRWNVVNYVRELQKMK